MWSVESHPCCTYVGLETKTITPQTRRVYKESQETESEVKWLGEEDQREVGEAKRESGEAGKEDEERGKEGET